MTAPVGPDRRWTRVGVVAAMACGVCCALPLIAVLGGIGVVSAAGVVLEVFERVSAVLALVALAAALVVWRWRRRRACPVAERKADLGMPAPARRDPR